MDGGCVVPVSHKLNQDGYFRKTWAVETGKKVTEMFHRFVYRAVHGLSAIPEGYEIDLCRNRACQNPEHLRLLDRPTHLDITNRVRWDDEYRERQAALA